MLAQSLARKPAPPLAARGMWLRLGVGPDAFGSALGDSIVGSIQQADADKRAAADQAQRAKGAAFTNARLAAAAASAAQSKAAIAALTAVPASDPYLENPPVEFFGGGDPNSCKATDYPEAGNASAARTVRAGDFGGSLERVARAQLGPNASQHDINNYVGQLFELNGIQNARTIGGDRQLTLPGADSPAATSGLTLYGKDVAIGENLKAQALAQAQNAQAAYAAKMADIVHPNDPQSRASIDQQVAAGHQQYARYMATPNAANPSIASLDGAGMLTYFIGGSAALPLTRFSSAEQNSLSGLHTTSIRLTEGATMVATLPQQLGFGGEGPVSAGYFAIGAGTAGAVNAGVQYARTGKINWIDVGYAGVTGGLTFGKSPLLSLPTNLGGAVSNAVVNGDDVTWKAGASVIGTFAGAAAGDATQTFARNVVISNVISSAGRPSIPATVGVGMSLLANGAASSFVSEGNGMAFDKTKDALQPK